MDTWCWGRRTSWFNIIVYFPLHFRTPVFQHGASLVCMIWQITVLPQGPLWQLIVTASTLRQLFGLTRLTHHTTYSTPCDHSCWNVTNKKCSKPCWFPTNSTRRQHCCRGACQISEWSYNSKYKSCGFKTLQDHIDCFTSHSGEHRAVRSLWKGRELPFSKYPQCSSPWKRKCLFFTSHRRRTSHWRWHGIPGVYLNT